MVSYTGCSEIAFTADNESKYYGPFHPVADRPVLKKELRSGSLEIGIESIIPDTWEFSPIVVLEYDNGTKTNLYGFGIKTVENGKAKARIEF